MHSMHRSNRRRLYAAIGRASVISLTMAAATLASSTTADAQCSCPDWCGDTDVAVTGTSDYCQYPTTGCPYPEYASNGCCYWPNSPVIVDESGDGVALTDLESGVKFPLGPGTTIYQAAWTEAGSDDAWLVLDRNGNGRIDNGTELFGNSTPQSAPPSGQEKNGFLALAEYDQPDNGGNGDGIVDERDAVYASLRLWQDTNHDGESQSSELHMLRELGIVGIGLNYRLSERRDRFGNIFRYRVKMPTRPSDLTGVWAFDVFLRSRHLPSYR